MHLTLYTTIEWAILSGISSFVSGLGNIEMYSIQLAFAYWMGCKDRIFKNKLSCLHRYDKGNFKYGFVWKNSSAMEKWKGNKRTPFNVRYFASTEELVVLINLEDTNTDLMLQGIPNFEWLKIWREKTYRQLELLKRNQATIKTLKQNFVENR